MTEMGLRLLTQVTVGGRTIDVAHPPAGMRVDPELGLLLADEVISGQVVYTATDALYETRATMTPQGDYLLMFPTNTAARPHGSAHYGHAGEKVNDLVACRSHDRGATWSAPEVAFDIDYNQHGAVPLISRAAPSRIYAFGTQPVWGLYNRERGLAENAPIGYRFSDDDGHHWSEVRLIRPVNDPGYTGMSVMRMCETDAGTWLLGTHEGDWSYRPLQTRQYVLRSEDQGATWELLPHSRHGGWCVLQYGRMDEGRPIALGGGHVMMMLRTPEGHLWQTWSEDDGKTWTDPALSSLIHPDAPPMVFKLGDGETLAAFHHNRSSVTFDTYRGLGSNPEAFMDRSEIWVALSTDGGHTWSEPRFVFANAAAPTLENPFRNYQCSYMDAFVDGEVLNLFVPHRWQRALHLQMRWPELATLPMAREIGAA